MMEPIHRNACVITGKEDLRFLRSFKKFPVFLGCVSTPASEDLFFDMDFWISEGSGCIQLNPLPPKNLVYQAQHSEVVGTIWANHHKEFCEFVEKRNCRKVYEIGGAHGTLAKNYLERHADADWTIIEPNPSLPEGLSVKVLKEFFTSSTKLPENIDAVVHSHVFEHIDVPSQFAGYLGKALPKGVLHMFSVPHLSKWFAKGYTNALNFEHTCLLVEDHIDAMLTHNGFDIVEKKYFDEHSIFYATKRVREPAAGPAPVKNLRSQHEEMFNRFCKTYDDTVTALNAKIERENRPVYLFGAHVFSQYLISLGLNQGRIECLLDNAKGKIGQRLYGSKLQVKSPQELKNAKSPVVIMKCGIYNEEIKRDIVNNIRPDVEFWE